MRAHNTLQNLNAKAKNVSADGSQSNGLFAHYPPTPKIPTRANPEM